MHKTPPKLATVFIATAIFALAAVPRAAGQTPPDSPLQIIPNRRPPDSAATPTTPQIRAGDTGNALADEDSPLSRDEWFRIDFDGKHVGYEHVASRIAMSGQPLVSITPLSGNDAQQTQTTLIRRIRQTQLRLKRMAKDLSVSAILETLESADGTLHEWSLRRTAGDGSTIERSGRWIAESAAYEVNELVQGTQRTSRLTATQPAKSPMIANWFLAPPASGTPSPSTDGQPSATARQRFHSAVLFPETNSIVNVYFGTNSRQSLRLTDGSNVTVSRCEFWPEVDPALRTALFVDQHGAVLKSDQMLMGSTLSLIRTDAAGAIGSSGEQAIDLDLTAVISLRRPIANVGGRHSIRLKITANSGELLSIPEAEYQKIERDPAQPGGVFVTLTRPVFGASQPATGPLIPAANLPQHYLEKNRWLDFEDPLVYRNVRQAGAGVSDLETCRRMTRHLTVNLRRSVFSTSLQPASEVAKRMFGDCTEHAVLLAAMMRSRGIPSRVVIGLIYIEKAGAYAGHMWTEALIEGRWIPFDSTVGPDNFGITHLKLLDSALDDQVESGMILFLPLLNLIGRTQLETVSESASIRGTDR